MNQDYFVQLDEVTGPLKAEDIREMISNGAVRLETLCAKAGEEGWTEVRKCPEFADAEKVKSIPSARGMTVLRDRDVDCSVLRAWANGLAKWSYILFPAGALSIIVAGVMSINSEEGTRLVLLGGVAALGLGVLLNFFSQLLRLRAGLAVLADGHRTDRT